MRELRICYYTCNGCPDGCERERFGQCLYHEQLEKCAAEAFAAMEKHKLIVEPYKNGWNAVAVESRWAGSVSIWRPAPIDAVLALKKKLEEPNG